MCNCISEIEKKILENLNENPEQRTSLNISDGEWEHLSIYPKVRLFIKYDYKYTYHKKDGERSNPHRSSVNIFFTFCPFCGEKLK